MNAALRVVMKPGPVKYSEILRLERQLRECPMLGLLDTPFHGSPLDEFPDDAFTLHILKYWTLMIRETGKLL